MEIAGVVKKLISQTNNFLKKYELIKISYDPIYRIKSSKIGKVTQTLSLEFT
jgi:hypothetical protein